MDTLRTPVALTSLIASNLAPVAGILLLGWSHPPLLVLYLVDTFVGHGVVVLLVMAHITGNEQGRPFAGWKDWAKGLAGLALLGAIMAFPMALPLVMVIGDDGVLEPLLADTGFHYAVALQVTMSLLAGARMHRELKVRDDDDRSPVARCSSSRGG